MVRKSRANHSPTIAPHACYLVHGCGYAVRSIDATHPPQQPSTIHPQRNPKRPARSPRPNQRRQRPLPLSDVLRSHLNWTKFSTATWGGISPAFTARASTASRLVSESECAAPSLAAAAFSCRWAVSSTAYLTSVLTVQQFPSR